MTCTLIMQTSHFWENCPFNSKMEEVREGNKKTSLGSKEMSFTADIAHR